MAVSAQSTRVRRVLIALVLAGVFVFAGYLFSNPNLFQASAANAESTQALLAAYAQKKGPDGLPLWEDQLIATASSTAWANEASATANDTTPPPGIVAARGSLTDQFAQNVFSQYIQQEGGANPSATDIDTFAQSEIQTLVKNHAQQDIYSEANLHVSGNGASAMKAYAVAAQKAVSANSSPTAGNESELNYLSDAVEKGQTDELKEVAVIGSDFTNLAPALMAIQVPSEAQRAHLEIANAFARLGTDDTDMSMMETDPLLAYLGLSAYETDAASLAQGFADLSNVFTTDQVTLSPQNPGYDFYHAALVAAQTVNASGGNATQ